MKQTPFRRNLPHLRNSSQNLGNQALNILENLGIVKNIAMNIKNTMKLSGQNTPRQNENIQGQPEISGRVAEQLVGSKQEKLDKKRKSIPKEEAAAIKSAGNTKGKASFRLGTMNRIENHLPL